LGENLLASSWHFSRSQTNTISTAFEKEIRHE
jgi:hypothetical protein